jgi:hypothetical protein
MKALIVLDATLWERLVAVTQWTQEDVARGGPPGLAPLQPLARALLRIAARHGKNPAKSAVARKLLIAAWHMLSRDEPFKPAASTAARTLPRRAPARANRSPQGDHPLDSWVSSKRKRHFV